MYNLSILFCWAWLLLLPHPPQDLTAITSAEAKRHVGERVKVCGVIASIYEPRRSRRNPTMLNFDKPYPQTCVTGQIRDFKGRAQMTLSKAEQLTYF